jgi:hypothetical protein
MFDLATSHNGEGLFVWLVIPHPVELGLLTTSLLMQWNIKLEEAFIITTPNSARLDTMSTPVSACEFVSVTECRSHVCCQFSRCMTS